MTEVDLSAREREGAGRMTQVMRGVSAPKATRALRVAVVQRGRVIEEVVFEPGQKVSIGPTERSTFVVAEGALPPKFMLFEDPGSGFRLNVLPFMKGRVVTAAGPVDLAAVKSVALGENARGKVSVGETTFLFQMVAPKPPRTKVPLPLGVRVELASGIDWTTAIVAAFSFLFHFGVVATLYGDWIDPLVDDQVDVGSLVEMVKSLPPPPVEHAPRVEEAVSAPSTAKASEPAAKTASGGAAKGGATGSGAATGAKGSGKAMGDARAAELSQQMAAANLEMIGVLNAHGPGAVGVLDPGDLPLGLLNDAARDAAGAGRGRIAGLDVGHGGNGVVRPGGGGRTLADVGNTQGGAPASAGSAIAAPRPHGNAVIGGAEPHGGEILNPGGAVAAMSPGFRACYNRGITTEDPTMKGTIRLTIKVAPNGDVAGVSTSAGGSLSSSVVGCVARRAQNAHFTVPEGGGGGTLVVPVTFTQ